VEEVNGEDREVGQVAVGSVFSDPWSICQVQKIEEDREGEWTEVSRKKKKGSNRWKKTEVRMGQKGVEEEMEELRKRDKQVEEAMEELRRRAQLSTREWKEECKMVAAVEEEKGKLNMTFQVCDVMRALAAVSRIADKGNRVVFEHGKMKGGYIENVAAGKRIKMRRKGEAYVIDVVINGKTEETTIDPGAEEPVCLPWWSEEAGLEGKGGRMKLVNASGAVIKHHWKRKVDMEASVF
jgi:hypothetical protein